MRPSATAVERLVGEATGPSDRSVAGMPAPVWTMLLWLLMMISLGGLSRLQPMAEDLPMWPRYVAAAVISVGVIALLVLRARTPVWLLHALVAFMIVLGVALVSGATNAASAITPVLLIMVVAAYTSYWMPMRVSLAYVVIGSVAMLAAIIANVDSGRPYSAWLIVTTLGLAMAFLLGTLISDLKRQAVTDPLTGLLNRSGLAILTELKPGAGRQTLPRTLVVLDLDDFKRINDERGHLEGDRVLREFADALVEASRADDILARSGGDEFILVLPGTDLKGAEALVARLRSAVTTEFSHGAAGWDAGQPFDGAMARADEAMYATKAQRRNL